MQQRLESLPRLGLGGEAQPRGKCRAQPAFELAQSFGGHSAECGIGVKERLVSEPDVECRTPDGRYLGEPHFNRRLVGNTPYAAGYAVLKAFA